MKVEQIYKTVEVQCAHCHITFDKRASEAKRSKNHFCSQSCAASLNNKGVQRNKPSLRECNTCCIQYTCDKKHTSKTLCPSCSEERTREKTPEYIKKKTLGEYQNKISVKGKHRSWLNSAVRNFNRSWNKGLTSCPCQVCGYSAHVELCHIKPISDFDKSATLGDVNNPNNLLVLCRNHHWEFDKGLLKLEEIPKREV